MITTNNPVIFGAASEVITPFTEDGEIELGLLKNEIEFMSLKGVTGFFVNGLASEALMMSAKERYETALVVRKITEGKASVLGNILSNSTQDGIQVAKEYQDLGMDAITITPPAVYKFTTEGLYVHFTEIANSVSIPTFLYNAPETNTKLPPELLIRLINQNPSFIGYKDSSQNFVDLLTLLDGLEDQRHFELMSGSDALTVPIMMLGGIGVISLITTVFPELIVKTCTACMKGDWKTALELQSKVIRVRTALKVGPFMAAYKYAGSLVGNPMGFVRKPLTNLNVKEMNLIQEILNKEDLL